MCSSVGATGTASEPLEVPRPPSVYMSELYITQSPAILTQADRVRMQEASMCKGGPFHSSLFDSLPDSRRHPGAAPTHGHLQWPARGPPVGRHRVVPVALSPGLPWHATRVLDTGTLRSPPPALRSLCDTALTKGMAAPSCPSSAPPSNSLPASVPARPCQ